MEAFFDAANVFTFRSLINPAIGVPPFTYVEGPGLFAMPPPKTFDMTQWYNTVCVEAGGGGIPVPIPARVVDSAPPPKPNPIIPRPTPRRTSRVRLPRRGGARDPLPPPIAPSIRSR